MVTFGWSNGETYYTSTLQGARGGAKTLVPSVVRNKQFGVAIYEAVTKLEGTVVIEHFCGQCLPFL